MSLHHTEDNFSSVFPIHEKSPVRILRYLVFQELPVHCYLANQVQFCNCSHSGHSSVFRSYKAHKKILLGCGIEV